VFDNASCLYEVITGDDFLVMESTLHLELSKRKWFSSDQDWILRISSCKTKACESTKVVTGAIKGTSARALMNELDVIGKDCDVAP
jgi:hypothetical protein